jgi:hypothetical protein
VVVCPQPPATVLFSMTVPVLPSQTPYAATPPLPVIRRLPAMRRQPPSSQRTPTEMGGKPWADPLMVWLLSTAHLLATPEALVPQ